MSFIERDDDRNIQDAASPSPETLRCPTCGARQVWSAECRRCKCDLTMVVAIHQRARQLHVECLRHWRAGRLHAALDCARQRVELSPDEPSRRLLALAYLKLGRYRAALDVSEF